MSDEQILDELRRVARAHGDGCTLTRNGLRAASALVSDSVAVRRFGSWTEALKRAGLEVSPLGRRWTDDDYYENLLAVWTHHGRQPRYRELNNPPSLITNGAYEKKFGTWRRALEAFIERVNADLSEGTKEPRSARGAEQLTLSLRPSRVRSEESRTIPLGLRYKVLARGRFRCSICGHSPATNLDCTLHLDHVVPVAHGGRTVEDNLRALCADCNLGKGARVESRLEA